jgi:hypothetical protein
LARPLGMPSDVVEENEENQMRLKELGFGDKSIYETIKVILFDSMGFYSISPDLSYLLGWGGLAPQGFPFTSPNLSGLLDLYQTRGHRLDRCGLPNQLQ